MSAVSIDPKFAEILTHMLGATPPTPRKLYGFRNDYCIDLVGSSPDYAALLEMERAGLVVSGRRINQGTSQYFHATREGCKAIGLSKAAMRRARIDDLTEEQRDALETFALKNWPKWKTALRDLWARAVVETELEQIVYMLRNTHGPAWLAEYRLAMNAVFKA